MKALTVQQLARISGVTVRTLHYYDEVGLLKPSFVKENGYRYYDTDAQLKLQQILFFKELDFSLEQIIKVMNNVYADKVQILTDQKELLQLKKKRLEKILRTIDQSIVKIKADYASDETNSAYASCFGETKGGEDMNTSKQFTDDSVQIEEDSGQVGMTNHLYEAFDMSEINEYHDEAKERWGNTEAWKQSQERTKHWTKADYQKLKADGDRFMKEFASKVKFGVDSKEVQEDIDKMYLNLNTFYTPTIEMFRNLGQMYVDDPRFTAYYEKYAPGLAVFVRDAINIYCDKHEEK